MGEICMAIKDENKFDALHSMIYQSIGHASVCWEFPEKAGIFDTEQACSVGDKLYKFVLNIYEIEKSDGEQ